MIIVIDTNIIFSTLLKPTGIVGIQLMNSFASRVYIAPEFLKRESRKHEERIKNISGFSHDELHELMQFLYGRILFYSEEIIPQYIWNHTYAILKDGDEKDFPFVAMALFFQAKLWTGDSKLKNQLNAKSLNICL